MKPHYHAVAALVLALAAATTATADSRQLAASAGIAPSEAASLTLTEIARIKFNADTRRDDRAPVAQPAVASNDAARSQLIAAAGLTPAEAADMSLTDLAMAKNARESRGDDRVRAVADSGVIDGGAGRAQIVAAIGLDPEVGRAMTLHEIYLEKFVRESSDR